MWVIVMTLAVMSCGVVIHGRPQQQQHHDQDLETQQLHVQPRDINVINEPTCDELKAMWRFSKRQARTPEIMNEITTYKDPFSYNEWSPYYSTTSNGYVSSSRSAGGSAAGGGSRFRTGSSRRPVFGRVVHKAPLSAAVGFPSHGGRGYEQVARLYGALQGEGASRRQNVLRFPGGGVALPAQTGRFQHLKEIIRTERARELQQQRAAEELAARAAALKEIAGGQRSRDEYHGSKHREYLRAPWATDEYNMAEEPAYYHTARDRYSVENHHQHPNMDAIITYPDLLAPPSRRSPSSSDILWQRNPSVNEARGDLMATSGVDRDNSLLVDPLFGTADEGGLYFDPFTGNLHGGFGRGFFDTHAIRRSDLGHGIHFN